MGLTAPVASSTMPAPWYREVTPVQRRALIAASLGWMLDSMDFMTYALVLAYLMKDFGMGKPVAGLLTTVAQIAAAVGGVIFGVIADRFGRARALMASILVYSLFTGASGLAHSVTQLAVLRALVGIGLGGEWAAGAALVSETWPDAHRGKALGLMQSSWAIGYALAALITGIILPRWGWRAVFLFGTLPALLTLWIRRSVEEPAIWQERTRSRTASAHSLGALFANPFRRYTIALALMNAGALFAYWGFNSWNPAFLSLSPNEGGVGLSAATMSWFVIVMQMGTWLGYVSYGFIADRAGRKATYVAYLLIAAALLPLYSQARSPALLLGLGPAVGFFGTGFFSGLAAVAAELFPTDIRATAMGFTYNLGRVLSAIAPFAVGSLAEAQGFSLAFGTLAVALLFAAIMWSFIPETKGRALAP
jgi:MFS family permease